MSATTLRRTVVLDRDRIDPGRFKGLLPFGIYRLDLRRVYTVLAIEQRGPAPALLDVWWLEFDGEPDKSRYETSWRVTEVAVIGEGEHIPEGFTAYSPIHSPMKAFICARLEPESP